MWKNKRQDDKGYIMSTLATAPFAPALANRGSAISETSAQLVNSELFHKFDLRCRKQNKRGAFIWSLPVNTTPFEGTTRLARLIFCLPPSMACIAFVTLTNRSTADSVLLEAMRPLMLTWRSEMKVMLVSQDGTVRQEKFVELLQQQSCLSDVSSSDYHDRVNKDKCWWETDETPSELCR